MGKGVRVRNTVVNGGMTGRDENLGKIFAHKVGTSFSTMKKYVAAGNPNSDAQSAVRSMFAQTSAGWSALTEAQRNLWNAAAPDWANTGIFGKKSISGKNLFTGVNIVLRSAGLADPLLVLEPGSKVLQSQIASITLQPSLHFIASFLNDFDQDAVQLRISAPQSAGTSVCGKTSILYNSNTGSDINEALLPAYTAKYGAPIAGQKAFYEIYTVTTGGATSVVKSGFVTLL